MTPRRGRKALVILSADKNTRFALEGLLSRHESLAINKTEHDIYVHPEHDPQCLHGADSFLRPFAGSYDHALVVFDREGCGAEQASRSELESQVEQRLAKAGWEGRAAAVVIDPELEVWVWSDSPHVQAVLGWAGREPDLHTWLIDQGLLKDRRTKPDRPKEAVERVLRVVGKPRSSALYAELARKVSLGRCDDPAFVKLRTVLQKWFGR